ncbi:hypothetical protein FRC14_004978 [Serendipita sp. 396]|nr:hypothetical protein FRC14_004978 [Serendipita sp. 396]KAG8787156.1 hypothetical protein FRC15_009901 [Serendipita sp. 397]
MHSKALLLAFVLAGLSVARPLVTEGPSNKTVTSTSNSTSEAPANASLPAPPTRRHVANLSKLLVQNKTRRSSLPFNKTTPVDPTAAASRGAGAAPVNNGTMPHIPRSNVEPSSAVIPLFPRFPTSNHTENIPSEEEEEGEEEEEEDSHSLPAHAEKRHHNQSGAMHMLSLIPSSHGRATKEESNDSHNQTHSSMPVPHLPRDNANSSVPATVEEHLPESLPHMSGGDNYPNDGTHAGSSKRDEDHEHESTHPIHPNVHIIQRDDSKTSNNNTRLQLPVHPPATSHGAGGPFSGRSESSPQHETPLDQVHDRIEPHGDELH